MTPDSRKRLEEIKLDVEIWSDTEWLISELEKAWAEIERLNKKIQRDFHENVCFKSMGCHCPREVSE